MRTFLGTVTLCVAVGFPPLAPTLASESLPLDGGDVVADDGVPADVVALLKETKDTYGSDALLLQLKLLHQAIRAGSILTTGVRVRGVETQRAHRYLVFFVDTGIVFNSRRTDRRQRVDQLWTGIVTPALARLKTCDVPAEGVAVELLYSHRPYRDVAELERTATEDPGRYQQLDVYLLRDDILAFLQKKIDGRRLFSRSAARVAAAPLGGSAATGFAGKP